MRYLPILAAAISFNTFADSTPNAPHIYIQGQAQITTSADRVLINVGILEVDKDLMAAKQKADQTMAKAIKLAKQTGVLAKDINAGQLSIHRETQYNRETNKQEFVGFRVSRSLSLTLNDVEKYPSLLQNLVNGGINQVNQSQFVSSKYNELQQQAQKLAIKDAKSAAAEFAQNYDVNIKGLYSASMSPMDTSVQPYTRAKMAMSADAESVSVVPDSYHVGDITITASSYAIYLIENQ
ncbi:SIMPL domain-containing protein [Pseudoalteromonas shioyasakiensis]|uniref:SIMPL domain-containing protein n=1 Tax=Pseudoalteromonas shioyasakiensis TaxID=1190813 RepID=UPI00211942F0|nr:SIMPL domain-containing protein [Pseudoalteromonas shioyasakiensis]MCQ8876726.1 SIMPL domain-containing protein [Pseudoalteromonas shioyasakiensis]